MRLFPAGISFFLVGLAGHAQPGAAQVWAELAAKRNSLPSIHQEFNCSQTYNLTSRKQSSSCQIVIDMSSGQWREQSGPNSARIFDGMDLFQVEVDDGEYVRVKRDPKAPEPQPSVYDFSDLDPSKAVELGRRPCDAPVDSDPCIVLQLPVRQRTHLSSNGQMITVRGGERRLMADVVTGLMVSSQTAQAVDNQRTGYRQITTSVLERQATGGTLDPDLFRLPHGLREVKRFAPWNAARIRKQLAGKPAPDFTVVDLAGNSLALSSFKGKTVLLDFWATWCPPCQTDAPALEKLDRRYRDRDLVIVGLSMGEDRATVQKFLKASEVHYSVVLTSENQIPRPYQVSAIPTYIVIDRDGNVTSASEGDQGFADLRKLLKRSGLETD